MTYLLSDTKAKIVQFEEEKLDGNEDIIGNVNIKTASEQMVMKPIPTIQKEERSSAVKPSGRQRKLMTGS